MRQLPGKKDDPVIRVQMDEAELHRLLDPILQEVNSLRARVTELETNLSKTLGHMNQLMDLIGVLADDYRARQDDGK